MPFELEGSLYLDVAWCSFPLVVVMGDISRCLSILLRGLQFLINRSCISLLDLAPKCHATYARCREVFIPFGGDNDG